MSSHTQPHRLLSWTSALALILISVLPLPVFQMIFLQVCYTLWRNHMKRLQIRECVHDTHTYTPTNTHRWRLSIWSSLLSVSRSIMSSSCLTSPWAALPSFERPAYFMNIEKIYVIDREGLTHLFKLVCESAMLPVVDLHKSYKYWWNDYADWILGPEEGKFWEETILLAWTRPFSHLQNRTVITFFWRPTNMLPSGQTTEIHSVS